MMPEVSTTHNLEHAIFIVLIIWKDRVDLRRDAFMSRDPVVRIGIRY